MNILLIGARASGKTTLGRNVAAMLRRRFVDLDAVALGSFAEDSVSQVWASHGEQAWRIAEADALADILRDDDQIVALGGGTPMIPQARSGIDIARDAGRARCIYLHCDAAELARRLTASQGDRPSLTGTNPADEIASVLAKREPTYRAMADSVVDVTLISPAHAADELVLLISER